MAKKLKQKSDIFSKAKVVKAKEPKPKSNGKKEVNLGSALNVSAAISALTDSLGAIKETVDIEIKEKMAIEFACEALRTQRKPESFRGVSEHASASCEIRKRSTRSVLTPEEVDYLKRHGIQTETKVIKDAVPERYFFNPKAFEDPKLVEKISKRLEDLTTDDGEGLIMLQEGKDSVEAQVVGADTLDEVAKIGSRELLIDLFQIVSVYALGKFKLNDTSLESIFAILKDAGIDAKIEKK